MVGDPHQAIYSFRGADPESFQNLSRALGIENRAQFSLTRCRRCPQSHVELAQLCLTEEMTAHRTEIGEIEFLTLDEIQIQLITNTDHNVQNRKANLVLCRRNKPLVKLAYKCVQEERNVSILGEHNIGDMVRDLIDRFQRQTAKPFCDFVSVEEGKMIGFARTRQLFHRIVFLEEYFDIVRWLYRKSECNLTMMHDILDALFRPVTEDHPSDTIYFSSIHRAKGDEAETVWILQAELFLPTSWGQENDLDQYQMKQELNCLYVALTRCRNNRLIIGRSKEEENPVASLDDLMAKILQYKELIYE